MVKDDAELIFRDEDNVRWRIRWFAGATLEELVSRIEWRTVREL